MVDFRKLLDPAWRAESEARRAKEDAERVERDRRIREAIELCEANGPSLSEKEVQFVRSLDRSIRVSFHEPSEKQLQWLFDIAARFEGQLHAPRPRPE